MHGYLSPGWLIKWCLISRESEQRAPWAATSKTSKSILMMVSEGLCNMGQNNTGSFHIKSENNSNMLPPLFQNLFWAFYHAYIYQEVVKLINYYIINIWLKLTPVYERRGQYNKFALFLDRFIDFEVSKIMFLRLLHINGWLCNF